VTNHPHANSRADVEHVGIANHPTYFRTVHRLFATRRTLSPSTIALRIREYERVRRRKAAAAVALARYIFPGGEVDHLAMSIANLEQHGFEVHDVEAWRELMRALPGSGMIVCRETMQLRSARLAA